ncbi:hypothetical protein BKA65DRAFT_474039 [Rhexocercosporidium sp. MPI-PUGE-AT-0058]|nr:hypothetical protein BKA65DRAFT_474039 [Rhexocercosporidium sp. MPI-PUGE-AT-0058]
MFPDRLGDVTNEQASPISTYSKDLKILDGLAKSRRHAAEGGQHDTVAVLDEHMMRLEKEMIGGVAQRGEIMPPADKGKPWWFAKPGHEDLAWWWEETAVMHRLQERTEQRKAASLNALMKTVDNNHEEMEKSIHEQPCEDWIELSDAMVDYLKHEAAPHAVEQLKIYLADLQIDERIDGRILKELDLTLRWKDCQNSDEEELNDIDLKTLYPTPRQMLVEDALRALRDYRQALLSYGSEFENDAAFSAMLTVLRRDDDLPKAVASTIPQYVAGSNDSCSCGEECFVASLSPLPSPPTTPDLSIEDQENIERLKQFDKDVREWSAYLQQELGNYRHYLSTSSVQVNDNVLKSAKEVVALAKGKGKTDLVDTEVTVIHGCMGTCSEFAATEEDAQIEDKELRISKSNEERFQNLPDDLQFYCETVAKNIHRAEVDRQLLSAAHVFIEMMGEEIGDQKDVGGKIEGAEDDNSESKENAKLDTYGPLSEGLANLSTNGPNFAEQANQIKMATAEAEGKVDSQLVVASEKVATLMKESADAGNANATHDDAKLLDEAEKLVKLAKAEIQNSSKDLTPEPEPGKKEKRKKTVRFANKLVEILGEMKPSSS